MYTPTTSLVGRVTAKVLSWLRDDDGGNVWTDDDSRAWLDASDSYCHASDHLIFCQATAAIESVGSLLSDAKHAPRSSRRRRGDEACGGEVIACSCFF